MDFPRAGQHNRSAAVLSPEQAEDVIRRCTAPVHDALFAQWYGVSRQCISLIRRGQTWRELRAEVEAGKATTEGTENTEE